MSGAIDYSQLMPQMAASTGGAMLQAIYASGASSAGSPGGALAALATAERNQSKDIAATAAVPTIARDIAAFTAGVAAAKTVTQLLANPAVLKVLLTANGLGSDVSYVALAQKALTSNLNDPKALANTLADSNWKNTAETYQFASQGLAIIQQPSVIQTVANAYAEVQWRQSLDAAYPGLSNALTFRAEANTITSVDQILGDPVMRDVVTTALGIPIQIAVQPLDAQQLAITSALDFTRFKSPQFTEQFVQRYLVAMAQNSSAASSPSLDTLAISAAGLVA